MLHVTALLLAALQAAPVQDALPVTRRGAAYQLQGPEGQILRSSTIEIEGAELLQLEETRVALWAEAGREYAAIAVDGKGFHEARALDSTLYLFRETFDPRDGAPSFANSPLNAVQPADGWGVHIVQLRTPSLAAVRAQLREAGGEILRYLPSNAHLVAMDAGTAAEVAELETVRWVGPYHPEYRMSGELLGDLLDGELPRQRYFLQAVRGGLETKQHIAERIRAFGGEPSNPSPRGSFMNAVLTGEQLGRVAGLADVLYVEEFGEPQTFMDKVRVDGGADYIETTLGFTGQGVRGEVMDSGSLATHPGFQANAPLIHDNNDTNNGFSHGTAVSGIVFGDGTNLPAARGLLPDGQMIIASFVGIDLINWDRNQHTAELLQPPFEAVFQTNSWGWGGLTVQYNLRSTEMDEVCFEHDILLLQAQGNSGSTGTATSAAQAWAKNIISVGGIQHLNTQSIADDTWNFSGSRGPAFDGRIKPDLCFWNDSIQTTAGTGGYQAGFNGTSASTPAVAGYFGLFFQMWHEGVFGNQSTGATVFESRPKTSLARAMVINTADQYTFQGGTHDLRRVHQGWGRPDVERMFELRDRLFYVEETEVLTELDSVSWDLEVAAGEPELRATLVYLDPPGLASSSQNRINDVSLRVTSPSGVVYWGNRGMRTGNFTQAGGNSNTKDTVENVWLENPEVGTWNFEVIAAEIAQDAHLETPGVDDVDFSLVVTGIVGDNCGAPAMVCNSTANSSGQEATLSSGGTVSVSANDLTFSASDLPANQQSILFYGPNTFSVPFGDGNLCVGGPYGRLGLAVSDAVGNASWSVDLNTPPNGFSQITAGSTWTFQVWFRDPAAGGAGFNLSQALEAVFCD